MSAYRLPVPSASRQKPQTASPPNQTTAATCVAVPTADASIQARSSMSIAITTSQCSTPKRNVGRGRTYRRRTSPLTPTSNCAFPTLLLLFVLLIISDAHAVQARKPTKTNPPWLNSLKNGLASAGAAACCKTLLHPVDCIKTLQQYSPDPLSVTAAFRQLYESQQLFAGLAVTVFGSLPSVAVYFAVYAYVRERLLQQSSQQQQRMLCTATAAAIGNTVASVTRVPYETAKQRLQTGQSALAGWSLLSGRGIGAQMLRDIPYAMITLVVYESLQQRRKSKRVSSDFVLGGLAGGIGSWLTNPMDVIKTRVQTGGSGIGAAIHTVWNEGGLSAFLRGSVPRLVHKVPANAFFFLFYELFRRLLRVDTSTASRGKKSGSKEASRG